MDGGPDAGCRLHGELRGQEIFYDALLPFLGEPSQSIAWTTPPLHMAAAIPRSWVPRSDPADSEPDFGGGEGYLIPFYNQATLLFVALAAISYLLLLVCVCVVCFTRPRGPLLPTCSIEFQGARLPRLAMEARALRGYAVASSS